MMLFLLLACAAIDDLGAPPLRAIDVTIRAPSVRATELVRGEDFLIPMRLGSYTDEPVSQRTLNRCAAKEDVRRLFPQSPLLVEAGSTLTFAGREMDPSERNGVVAELYEQMFEAFLLRKEAAETGCWPNQDLRLLVLVPEGGAWLHALPVLRTAAAVGVPKVSFLVDDLDAINRTRSGLPPPYTPTGVPQPAHAVDWDGEFHEAPHSCFQPLPKRVPPPPCRTFWRWTNEGFIVRPEEADSDVRPPAEQEPLPDLVALDIPKETPIASALGIASDLAAGGHRITAWQTPDDGLPQPLNATAESRQIQPLDWVPVVTFHLEKTRYRCTNLFQQEVDVRAVNQD
ncbi:MAG: hypothetical protein HN348_29470 [Proteobacteria bacterium]|jgi:hypothetical protein|nr:hypothetical protein [Pseudomonadota bacterium]